MTTLITPVVVSEEAQPTTPTSALPALARSRPIAVAMSLYHMYVAAFGPPEAIIFRGTHLLFALALVFLLYPTRPGRPAWRVARYRAAGAGRRRSCCTSLSNYEYFINRIIYIDDLTSVGHGSSRWPRS